MLTQEQDKNDTTDVLMATMDAEEAPAVVSMDERSSESPDPESSCAQSSAGNASSPCKKQAAADRELRQPFPVKVYEMLENAEKKGFSNIVSWNENGTGFMVHDKDHFTKEIVPHYFNLTKYKSFQRQLSLYGFQRVTVGPNKGLRYHEKLRKGELALVRQMKPVGYKPRNLSRLLEQKRQKQQQQQVGRGTNILTTTTTTMVKTTTTTTTLLANDPSKNGANATAANAIIDTAAPRDVTYTTVLAKSPSPSNIPPVVSSNSLIKQGDHEDNGQNQYHVHAISPETTCHNAIHMSSNASQLHMETSNQSQQQTEIVDFEGMCFHLMSPTRELGINVKLKLLEEFNPSSSLLKLASKYVAAGQTTTDHVTIPSTIPITIDTVQSDRPSLLEPFTDIVSTAAATSTASTIAALQTAAANAVTYEPISATTTPPPMSSPSKPGLETRCVDPLDFHTQITVANRI
eukprot:CAMPEP_0197261970 /NCGR_PEP_ID=MMETSP1432-20130617/256_1 /TAXON_ID=44447 /ORGANISM="Pseudo-nitzschia delicatissima, Strain UNC1205" /LENGTH=460 /DNA_ID=CAMNT_0042726267 /DNA_START=48 /DNA_END=1430 /DNA_ORIENTATION=-